MFSVSSAPPAGAPSYRKTNLTPAYIMSLVLALVSAWGFFDLVRRAPSIMHPRYEQLFYMVSLAVVPLVLLLFVLVRTIQQLNQNRVITSYQMRLDQLQSRLNAQEDFVRAVTDSTPEPMVIYDKDNRYWFVNLSAAKKLGHDASEMVKKPVDKIIGYERAQKLEKRLNEVRTMKRPIESLDQIKDDNGKVRFVQAHYEPVASFGDFAGGIMVREDDVTNLIVERERRSSMLRQVIGTLVAVVDRRDPYASGHSARVGKLSRILAEELLLPESEIDAAEIAGSLMNFGKVLVPREILTKATALTPEELQRVRESILTSADILAIIDFDGPVVQTLRQVLERSDGSGVPQGLKGDQILMTARVVMVANAYVALVSPRAHRPSLSVSQSLENLMKDADRIFDRRVVEALSNCAHNRRDLLDWAEAAKQN